MERYKQIYIQPLASASVQERFLLVFHSSLLASNLSSIANQFLRIPVP